MIEVKINTEAYGEITVEEAIYRIRKDGKLQASGLRSAETIKSNAQIEGYNFGINKTALNTVWIVDLDV